MPASELGRKSGQSGVLPSRIGRCPQPVQIPRLIRRKGLVDRGRRRSTLQFTLCRINVNPDGFYEGLYGRKLHFRTYPTDEKNGHFLPVQIIREVEQVRFQERWTIVKSRPATVAGDAVVNRTIGTLEADGVDAVAEAAIGAA